MFCESYQGKSKQKGAIDKLMAPQTIYKLKRVNTYVRATSLRRLRARCIATTKASNNKAGI